MFGRVSLNVLSIPHGYLLLVLTGGSVASAADLAAVNRRGPGATEIHVYQGPLLQKHLVAKCTALHTTDKNWHFDVIDWNRDKIPDLVAINRQGQKATEVHVCDGAARYHARLVAKSTGLPKTNANWVFRVVNWDGDGVPDLVAVNRRDGEHTSVHVFSGASDFQDKLLAKVTGLHATDENWSFAMVTFAKLPPEATLRKEPIGEHPRRKKDIEAIKELSIKSEDPDPWPGSIFLEKAIFVQSYSDRAIDFTYRVTAVNINYRRETVRTGHAKPGERVFLGYKGSGLATDATKYEYELTKAKYVSL